MTGEKLIALFERAAGSLQYPRITILNKEGKVVIYRQGERSKNKGGLAITDGGVYGSSVFYGAVLKDGTVRLRDVNNTPQYVLDLIKDPVGEAIKSAKLTGNCCFCSTPLRNKSSLFHGYGPICAEKWGLPWGDVPKDTLIGNAYAATGGMDTSDL